MEVLAPRLKELLALRGIRFEEMEIVDRYAVEIPARCRLSLELYGVGQEVGGNGVLSAVTRRIIRHLDEVDRSLRDLVAFVPLWQRGIEGRRALLLVRGGRDGQAGQGSPPDQPPPPRDPDYGPWESDLS